MTPQRPLVVDGHVHLTNAVYCQGIDPWQPQATGGFDFARAKAGGLDVAIEHVFIEDGYNGYGYTVKQACRLLETILRVADDHADRMAIALTAADARRIAAEGRLAVVLALEGGFDVEGDLDVLRVFHRLGVRMVQLTCHDTTNAIADSYSGEQRWGGLSPHGRRVIAEMNRLGIVVDISHASDAAKWQAIEASAAPVVTSHNGLRRYAEVIGNLDEPMLHALADRGGLIGLHSAGWLIKQAAADWNDTPAADVLRRSTPAPSEQLVRTGAYDGNAYIDALDERMRDRWVTTWGYGQPWRVRHDRAIAAGAPQPTLAEWAEQAAWLAATIGPEHVGLGLDLMAGGNWLRDVDATSYGRFAPALAAAGLPDAAVRQILGEGWLRILESAAA